MTKKAVLVTCVAIVALVALTVDTAVARTREARPGQPRRVSNAAPAKVGGADCMSATDMDPASGNTFMFADTDNSCSATNKLSDYNNNGSGGPCNTVDYPGPDLIYTFSLSGTPNSAVLTLTPTAPADMGVFVITDCMDGTSCAGFDDQIGGGAISSVTLTDAAAMTYFVYVDSYYTSGSQSCGDYTLTLTGTRPVELMDFTVE